jgi:DNA-binding response OmpR family regulator
MQILLVEDDLSLADGLQLALKQEGIMVNHVVKGSEAIHVLENFPPDIVILDLGLPDMDGIDVIRQIRRNKNRLPILVLTARGNVEDKVAGLDAGADDYLAKPFDMTELLARVRVLERRISTSIIEQNISIGSVVLDLQNRQLSVNGNVIVLSKTEFMLLKTLMKNCNRVQTRDYLESQLYSWGDEVSSNTLEVHVHHLRKKISSDFIKTIRGVGYMVSDK